VTDDVLREYWNLHHLEPLSEGEYRDWLFRYNHDARKPGLVPAVLGAVAKYQYVREAVGEDERQRIIEANEGLENEICKLLERRDIFYQEVDIVTRNLGNTLQSIVVGAGRRANIMVATMLSFIAREKYGDQLKVKTLGEAY
jgi:hypothetical protein